NGPGSSCRGGRILRAPAALLMHRALGGQKAETKCPPEPLVPLIPPAGSDPSLYAGLTSRSQAVEFTGATASRLGGRSTGLGWPLDRETPAFDSVCSCICERIRLVWGDGFVKRAKSFSLLRWSLSPPGG